LNEVYEVRVEYKDLSIRELYELWKDGDLILDPKFQRYKVWDIKKSSVLVESVLLDIPIPTIYLAEDKDNRLIVVDGQQRLNALLGFMDGTIELYDIRRKKWNKVEFKLRGLNVLKELNDKRFVDLDDPLKRKYKTFTLRVVVIKKDSSPEVRYEIFERLNKGAVQLNNQELRNCIYRGPYNDLIIELSEDEDFLFLLGLNDPDPRMRDKELVLRFLAFYHTPYLNYKGPMKYFLNKEMEKYRYINKRETDKLRKVFRKSVELCKYVFGDKSFRRFALGDSNNPNGYWEKKINKALFDITMWGFTPYEKNQIIPLSDSIREELIFLMTSDEEFIESITRSTDKKEHIHIRFTKWQQALERIVGIPKREPRTFSLKLKEELWNKDPYCAICNQRINLLDDAEIDHIEEYWRGGKTIPENARLVHRYCNRARKRTYKSNS